MNVVSKISLDSRHLEPRSTNFPQSISKKPKDCTVAVIGAGPYGLAVSANLRNAGIETLTFGRPMSFWQENMPGGMVMRSPWRGSHIADGKDQFTLDAYAKISGIEPRDQFRRSEFVDYGLWFQKQAVPDLDTRQIARVERQGDGFLLHAEDGESFTAKRVVVALGLANQANIPSVFQDFPRELVSHTADHADFSKFRGKQVAVVGRGQSACESAALLGEAGASVELVAHGAIHWLGKDPTSRNRPRELALKIKKFLTPASEVGPVHLNWLIEFPNQFRWLSESAQDTVMTRCLRPAASGWLIPRFADIRQKAGVEVVGAAAKGSRIELRYSDGTTSLVDHVVLGTGYKVDISKYGILSTDIMESIAQDDGQPILDRGYESSLPGLHFVGSSSCKSFGPLMRFVWGAQPASRIIAQFVTSDRS